MYSMVQRREKEKDSRYIQEASAPAAVTVYQISNIMYSEGTKSRALPQNVEIRNFHHNNRENYERVGSENTPPEMLL